MEQKGKTFKSINYVCTLVAVDIVNMLQYMDDKIRDKNLDKLCSTRIINEKYVQYYYIYYYI